MVKNPSTNGRDAGSIPVLGRSPGGGNDNPLQYSCWNAGNCWKFLAGNPMYRGAWWAPLQGYKGSDTAEWLSIPNAQLDSLNPEMLSYLGRDSLSSLKLMILTLCLCEVYIAKKVARLGWDFFISCLTMSLLVIWSSNPAVKLPFQIPSSLGMNSFSRSLPALCAIWQSYFIPFQSSPKKLSMSVNLNSSHHVVNQPPCKSVKQIMCRMSSNSRQTCMILSPGLAVASSCKIL